MGQRDPTRLGTFLPFMDHQEIRETRTLPPERANFLHRDARFYRLLELLVKHFGSCHISGSKALWLWARLNKETAHRVASWNPSDTDIWLEDQFAECCDDAEDLKNKYRCESLQSFLNDLIGSGVLGGRPLGYVDIVPCTPIIKLHSLNVDIIYQSDVVFDLPICEVRILVDQDLVNQFESFLQQKEGLLLRFEMSEQTRRCVDEWSCPYASVLDCENGEQMKAVVQEFDWDLFEFIEKWNPQWISRAPSYRGNNWATGVIRNAIDQSKSMAPADVYATEQKFQRTLRRLKKYEVRGVTFVSSPDENYRAFSTIYYRVEEHDEFDEIPPGCLDTTFHLARLAYEITQLLNKASSVKPAKAR